MISLYTKIPKNFHFLGLSNFSRDMLIPLACNFQSVLSAQAPMDSFCNAIVSTFMFSRSQHWAFTNYVAYWFFRTLAQPVFWADSLLVNLCLYCIGLQRWSWAAVNNPSVSFLNSPFFNHVQERLLVTPSVCLKKWPCNVFPFQSATFSSFLCCLYCKESLSGLGFRTGSYLSAAFPDSAQHIDWNSTVRWWHNLLH